MEQTTTKIHARKENRYGKHVRERMFDSTLRQQMGEVKKITDSQLAR